MPAIPIQNVYYLFLYAWDRFVEGKQIDVGRDAGPDLPNLLASVLVTGTRNLIRRGLDRGYLNLVEELSVPVGRFLLGETVKRNSLVTGRIVCDHDELSVDVCHNQIVKATLKRLAVSSEIESGLAVELRTLYKRFGRVSDINLSRRLFRSIQLTRNSSHYGLLMRVCELAFELSQPVTGGQTSRFASVLDDEVRMSTVFESFVRNFFRHEQREFKVASEVISWDVFSSDRAQLSYLPTMLTDVTLRSTSKTIVIDAKFWKDTLVSHMGGHPKVRSAHLYQLLAYLKNLERLGGVDRDALGILLYPSTDDRQLRLQFKLSGHLVRIWNVDLMRPWQEIRQQLLSLLVPIEDDGGRSSGVDNTMDQVLLTAVPSSDSSTVVVVSGETATGGSYFTEAVSKL